MPELPEVETIKRELDRKIADKKIAGVILESSFEKKVSPAGVKFVVFLVGKRIKKISRRAKLLIFDLNAGQFLLIHLKLTGQLVYVSKAERPVSKLPNKFTRVTFCLSGGDYLFFNDLRKFGYMKFVDAVGLEAELKKYGIEPFDKNFSFDAFVQIIERRKNRTIKNVLIDQTLIAGIGNIYSDEICFCAGVRPTRLVRTLLDVGRKRIFSQIRKILSAAIKHKGSSVDDYVKSDGQQGSYQKMLKVYGRVGEVCRKCKKSKIVRVKINGRSSCYCPNCQK